MGVSKIQIGQLWKKDGTRDIYLVTRLYTEALSTMVVMRKSGAEAEALIRVKAERNSTGHNIPGFSPAQEEEKLEPYEGPPLSSLKHHAPSKQHALDRPHRQPHHILNLHHFLR